MKVTINVECTPEEARSFFGLPDVRPLQESMLDHMRQQMEKTVQTLDPEAVFKTLFPQSESLGELQKAFWSQFSGARRND